MDPSISTPTLYNTTIFDGDTTSLVELDFTNHYDNVYTSTNSSYPSPILQFPIFSTNEYAATQLPTPSVSLYSRRSRGKTQFCNQPSNTPSSPLTVTPARIHEACTMVSVSTAFHPGAHALDPDMIFSSSDMVLFYVHHQMLTSLSPNAFRRIVQEQQQYAGNVTPFGEVAYSEGIVHIPESSVVLNVILHMLYGTSSAQHSPTFDTLVTAVDHLSLYDIDPKLHITLKTPLYDLLLKHAPLYPLELYALAGKHDLYQLAATTSSHLLSYPLPDLPEELAEKMGAVYLKKLLCLHLDRFNKLKQILLQPPHPHAPTKECSFADQRKLTRAWALVSAYLAWDARPDLSTHSMQSALNPLTEHLTCALCHEALQKRIKDVVVQWVSVKRTI